MTFIANLGYTFGLPQSVNLDTSILASSTMPSFQLQRRKLGKYPYLKHRMFDPQLYLAGLDAAESPKHCTYLASYPWFGVRNLPEYDSEIQKQKDWNDEIKSKIAAVWPRHSPNTPGEIDVFSRDCVTFQDRLGCDQIILPSPLSTDVNSDYSEELAWLDAGLDYVEYLRTAHGLSAPVLSTLALADVCLRYLAPSSNSFLDLIVDNISARDVDGVYIVVEQGSETAMERQCGNTWVLQSILHLVHEFAVNAKIKVVVNYLGMFGLVCEAAGASAWASNWYKSLYRLRLADKLAGGRVYPSFWSHSSAADIHMDTEFDRIVSGGGLNLIADRTIASSGLLEAARQNRKAAEIPAWQYRQGNGEAAREHFLLSAINAEREHSGFDGQQRRDYVHQWLTQAVKNSAAVARILGTEPPPRTQVQHVQAWLTAFEGYRRDHNC